MAASVPLRAGTSASRSWELPGNDRKIAAEYLHALRHRDAEQAKAGDQDTQGQRGEGEPALAGGLVGRLQDRALLVERGERARGLEQERGELVRLGGLRHLADRRAEAQHLQCESQLGRLGQPDRPGDTAWLDPGPAEDRADPRGRVRQVRAGVAGQREHPVEIKHVTGLTIYRQVGVLQGADADGLGDLGAQLRIVVPVLDYFLGAPDRLVDQVDQLDRPAAPGTEPLAVRASDQADGGVLGADLVGQPARLAGDGEHHREVLGLLGPNHVDDAVRMQVTDPVPDRGHVRAGVAVAPVALAQDQRQWRPVAAGEPGREGAERTVADDRDALRLQFIADVREHRVVEALRIQVGVRERHAKPRVDAVVVLLGVIDQRGPKAQGLGIPRLQCDDPEPRPLSERRVGLELGVGGLVERVDLARGQLVVSSLLAHVEQVLEQYAELGAPVADMVRPDHHVAEVLENAYHGVTDDRGTEVTDVHLPGHIRRRVVDNYPLGGIRRGNVQARVVKL